MRPVVFASAAIVSLGVLFAGQARANFLSNGDFSAGLAQWNPDGPVSTVTDSSSGSPVTYAVFDSTTSGSRGAIYQSFTSVLNQQYILSFNFGVYSPAPAPQETLQYSGYSFLQYSGYSGNADVVFLFYPTLGIAASSVFDQAFVHVAYSFYGNGKDVTIQFNDVSSFASNDPAPAPGYLSNVSVDLSFSSGPQPVPMPEPYAVALFALGVVGLAGARRR